MTEAVCPCLDVLKMVREKETRSNKGLSLHNRETEI